MEPFDLPITKGLQERIHEFAKLDEEIELGPILEHIAGRRLMCLTLWTSRIACRRWRAG
jgi:hypothetical protein